MKFYQVGTIKDKKLEINHEKLTHMVENLYDGIYLITYQRIDAQSDLKQYSAYYFVKLDMMAREVGEGRYFLHEYIKEHVLKPLLTDIPHLHIGDGTSTTHLLIGGWPIFLEAVDLWAFLTYNIILP